LYFVIYHLRDIACVQLRVYYIRAAAVYWSLSCVASFLLAVYTMYLCMCAYAHFYIPTL